MSTTNFESLEFVRTLVAAGVPPAQAEAMARGLAKSFKTTLEGQIAMKADVQALSGDVQSLGVEIKTELKAMREEIQDQVQSEVRVLLTWQMFGLALIALIVILARVIG